MEQISLSLECFHVFLWSSESVAATIEDNLRELITKEACIGRGERPQSGIFASSTRWPDTSQNERTNCKGTKLQGGES